MQPKMKMGFEKCHLNTKSSGNDNHEIIIPLRVEPQLKINEEIQFFYNCITDPLLVMLLNVMFGSIKYYK